MPRRVNKDDSTDTVDVRVCGLCAKAYGYCCPGFDRSPIACRCPLHPERYMMVFEKGCSSFAERTEPVPETVAVLWSENREGHLVGRKVVPFFRKGEKNPWKVVPSDEIPPGGIASEG